MTTPKNIKTKAYVVEGKGAPFVLRDVILREAKQNEVLVEVKYTGVCHTDVVVQQGGMPVGHFPAVLGHEGAGIVRWVGSSVKDTTLAPGDIVALSFRFCGKCQSCQEGRQGECVRTIEINFLETTRTDTDKEPVLSLPDGTPVHGQFFGQSSMSKLAIVAEESVVKIGTTLEELPYLAPLGCGYVTGAGTMFNVLNPKSTDTVAVLGIGAVGVAALLAAKVSKAQKIIAVDILEPKLQKSLKLGATHAINSGGDCDLYTALRAVAPNGIDKIIDTTGIASIMEGAFRALGREGILAVVGVAPVTATLNISPFELMTSCKNIVGVVEGSADPHELLPRMFDLFKRGQFPVQDLAKVYPADKLPQALEDLKSGEVIKPVLSWDGI